MVTSTSQPRTHHRSRVARWLVSGAATAALIAGGAVLPVGVASAEDAPPGDQIQRRMEHLDRGLVAVKVESGVYLSWRFLGDEGDDTTFRVYRDGVQVAEVADSTNWSDAAGTAGSAYSVAPVVGGVEGERSGGVVPNASQFYDIPLQQPAAAVAPLLETFSRTVTGKVYEPVDMQLLRDVREAHENPAGITPAEYQALLDRFGTHFGDLEWTPKAKFANKANLVTPGYFRITDELFAELDAAFTRYVDELDRGPSLQWLRNADGSIATQSATYTPGDATVGDLDGDGDYELVLQWNPSNQKDSPVYGSTAPALVDAYTLEGDLLWRVNVGYNIRAGAHDTQLVVADFDGDGRSELIIKTADGTTTGDVVDGTYVVNDVIGRADARPTGSRSTSPRANAASLDEFYDQVNSYGVSWILPGGNTPPEQNVRQWGKVYVHGVIGTSNEYLTAFDGETGRVIDTVDYAYPYGEPNWGAAPVSPPRCVVPEPGARRRTRRAAAGSRAAVGAARPVLDEPRDPMGLLPLGRPPGQPRQPLHRGNRVPRRRASERHHGARLLRTGDRRGVHPRRRRARAREHVRLGDLPRSGAVPPQGRPRSPCRTSTSTARTRSCSVR